MRLSIASSRILFVLACASLAISLPQAGAAYVEGFDNVAAITDNANPLKWAWINRSDNPASNAVGGWNQGNTSGSGFNAQAGPADSFATTDFNAGSPVISNWFITPTFNFVAGNTFSFWTRTVTGSTYADRLDIYASTSGTSINVGSTSSSTGDFNVGLLSINSLLNVGTYPDTWTQYTINISSNFTGRIGFRYYIPDTNTAGNYIAIDSVSTTASLVNVPEPTTYALAGISMLVLAGVKRTRRNPAQA